MLTSERHRHILNLLDRDGSVSLRSLRSALPVTDMTLWRDLVTLEMQGQLRRVRGGAIRIDRTPEPAFGQKLRRALPQKKRIAARAAALFAKEGDLLCLEGGTTVAELLPHLSAPHLTVLTNSLQILTRANAAHRHLALQCSGGVLNPVSGNFVGPDALAFFAQKQVQTFFMSGTGLDLASGQLTDPNPREIQVKQAMAERAKKVVLLLDSTKLGVMSQEPVLNLRAIDALVIDSGVSARARRELEKFGPQIIVV